ncbi:MAG: hypothetical protein AB7G23_20380 [Vicinamibacterales bacterium]
MPQPTEDNVAKAPETSPHPTGRAVPGPLLERPRDAPHDPPTDCDGASLMGLARSVRQRMRAHEVSLGLVFPVHVRLQVALDAIEAGLTSGVALEVAVGYLMLCEVLGSPSADAGSSLATPHGDVDADSERWDAP